MRDDMQVTKDEFQILKDKVQDLEEGLHATNERISALALTLVNETNRNIQLLAENQINIAGKINKSVRIQDKSILNEVQISGLKMRVDRLEREMAELKARTA